MARTLLVSVVAYMSSVSMGVEKFPRPRTTPFFALVRHQSCVSKGGGSRGGRRYFSLRVVVGMDVLLDTVFVGRSRWKDRVES